MNSNSNPRKVQGLNKIKEIPILIRTQGTLPKGNQALLKKGAIPFPEPPWNHPLKELIETKILEYKSRKTNDNTQLNLFSNNNNCTISYKENNSRPQEDDVYSNLKNLKSPSERLYNAVLPIIIQELKTPQDDKSLATHLDIQVGQLRKWLKQAVIDKKIIKQTKNKQVIYEINSIE